MNYIKELPDNINGFQLRRLFYNNFCVVDYSLSNLNRRFITFMPIDANSINSGILYETVSRDFSDIIQVEKLMLKKLNLIEQFKVDFKGFFFLECQPLCELSNDFHLQKNLTKPFLAFDIWDHEKNVKSVAIIVTNLKDEIIVILNWLEDFLNNKLSENIRMAGEEFDSIDYIYNKIIYIYTGQSNIDKEVLQHLFKGKKLVLKMRDDFFRENLKPDFFISHDSRDKESVAKPLYDELTKKGFKVWYDEFSLKIGDSLTESIEKGISECHHGILILSKNFLSNEKWAKNELQSLKTKQIVMNKKIILPIWHQINEDDLKDNFWLLDKIGGNTNIGITELAKKIAESI